MTFLTLTDDQCNRIESEIPETTISAMVGTYLKISFLTPVLEVKVVHPVKLRAKE